MTGRRTGFRQGDRVRVERDESLYPPTRSWERYRGRIGFVVVPMSYGEVGVMIGAGRTVWFHPHELTLLRNVADLIVTEERL